MPEYYRAEEDEERRRNAVTRGYRPTTPRHQISTFWRHFAVLTIKSREGQIQDHLFLPGEGSAKWKSWKFKVVNMGPFFETGSMAGLMSYFW